MTLTQAQRQVAKTLREQGHETAALDYLLSTGGPPAAVNEAKPAALDPLAPTDGRDYLTHPQLKKLQAAQFEDLRTNHNELYVRSLKALGTPDAPVAA